MSSKIRKKTLLPAPPGELVYRAKAEWKRVIRGLVNNGYGDMHRATLVAYCSLFADMQVMNAEWKKNPRALIRSGTLMKINPLLAAKRTHAVKLASIAKDLGICLSDKNKGLGGDLSVSKEESPFAAFVSAGKVNEASSRIQ